MSHATAADETPASQPSAGEPTDPDPAHAAAAPSRSPSRASSSRTQNSKITPLLTLAPTGRQTPQDEDIPAIWNVISRAQDVVKDAERLENLTWRHWGRPQRRRRSSSIDTASSASVHTPQEPGPIRDKSAEGRSFAGTLKLLVEDDSSFKDWVGDAKRQERRFSDSLSRPQSHSTTDSDAPAVEDATRRASTQLGAALPPHTPIAGSFQSQHSSNNTAGAITPVPDLEIRLVEPTPVPSRVGSLGGVASERTPATRAAATQPQVAGVEEEEAAARAAEGQKQTQRGRKAKGGGFFIQSSPGKASESESPKSQPSPVVGPTTTVAKPPSSSTSKGAAAAAAQLGGPSRPTPPSGESESSAVVMNRKKSPRRAVSMATMHGRFQGEKRRAAQAIAARNADDDSTTAAEDDNDDEWEDDDDEDDDDGWEDETPSDPKPVAQPMVRQTSRGLHLPQLSAAQKKQRAAEKARQEAEREAQRQREMFAKQQIFGQPQSSEGLLTRQFRTGKSMVDLTKAGEDAGPPGLRRAPTHANFSAMGQSPTAHPPNLMRSKSTAAMPVQSGISVTSRRSHNSGHSDERRGPEGVEMESSDSDEDDYLASTAVERKLNQLAAKRAAKENPVPVPNGHGMALDEHGVVRPLSPTTRRRTIIMREMSESLRRNIILEREKSSGGVGPHTRPPPSTHMSRLPTSNSAVNLAQYRDRHHVPLSRHNSNFQLSTGGEELRGPELERHNSHPDLIQTRAHEYRRRSSGGSGRVSGFGSGFGQPQGAAQGQGQAGHSGFQTQGGASRSTSPLQPTASISPETSRKRSNVLGGGFLRPLTRATDEHAALGRTQSSLSINGNAGAGGSGFANVPGVGGTGMERAGPGVHGTQQRSVTMNGPPGRRSSDRSLGGATATAMVRSSTEGDQKEMERARMRRELQRRDDTSYRSHGW